MLSFLFKVSVLSFILFSTVNGQSGKIVIGTIESNFIYGEPDKHNPYIGIIHFYKNGNQWNVGIDSIYETKHFSVYFKGLKIGSVSSVIDSGMERCPYFLYPYRFKNKDIPSVGPKSFVFSGMGGEKCYRPLLISDANFSRQKNIPRYRQSNKSDGLLVTKYLLERAKELNLGNLDSVKENLIEKINKVLVINKDCYFIDADINLNMYCYKEEVPFNTDLSYFLTGKEKQFISERKKTHNSYFLVNKSKVTYTDYGLKYLDSGDFDDDGYEEIIFRMDKYNYTGYLMITNKWSDFIVNSWNYN